MILQVDRAALRCGFTQQHGRTRRGVNLMPVVHFQYFDVPVFAKLARGLLHQCGEHRYTQGRVACLQNGNVTRGIVPIRFAPEEISHQFGYYLLRSEPAQLQIQAKTYGTALQQINIRDLRQLTLPVPAPQDQEIIVQRLSALEEETQQLTAAYANKLTALDNLKKSLLHQAFSGQLTQ